MQLSTFLSANFVDCRLLFYKLKFKIFIRIYFFLYTMSDTFIIHLNRSHFINKINYHLTSN